MATISANEAAKQRRTVEFHPGTRLGDWFVRDSSKPAGQKRVFWGWSRRECWEWIVEQERLEAEDRATRHPA